MSKLQKEILVKHQVTRALRWLNSKQNRGQKPPRHIDEKIIANYGYFKQFIEK